MKTMTYSFFRRLLVAAASLLTAFTVSPSAINAAPTSAAYSVHVSGRGSPVFLIPGLGCSGEVWADTVKKLELSHECHVFTLAGFGGQPPIAGEFLSTMENALADYLRSHSEAHPTLVGHSLGGLLALKLAAENPDRVASVVVVDSLPFYAATQPGATPENARQYSVGLRTAMEQQSRDAFLAGARQGLPWLVANEAARQRVFSWMETSDQATVARAMADVIAADARADVGRVKCPLLLIEAGGGPGAVPAELFTEQYSAARLLTRVRVGDAHHFVMLDQPERFLRELELFLSARP